MRSSILTESISCDEAQSCSRQTITASNEDISCHGYRSCEACPLVDVFGNSTISCDGSYSCYRITTISLTHLPTNNNAFPAVNCDGFYSCGKTTITSNNRTTTINYTLNCNAEKSCFQSSIYNSNYVSCSGDRSCQETNMHRAAEVTLTGHLAGLNTKFYTRRNLTIGTNNNYSNNNYYKYRFVGGYSGYNATIYCENGAKCFIECFGNGCNNLRVVTSDNSTSETNCTLAEKSNICLDEYDYDLDLVLNILNSNMDIDIDSSNFIPNLIDTSMSTFENSFATCMSNVKGAQMCEDYLQCTSRSVDTSDTLSPICCLADSGCSNIPTIESVSTDIDLNSISVNDSIIRCDGEESCTNVEEIVGSDIYITATGAGSSTNSIVPVGDRKFDVFITGQYAAMNVNQIQNVRHLYCMGYMSCFGIDIIEEIRNAFVYSAEGAKMSTMKDVSNNIYCAAKMACYATTVRNVTNSVHVNGYRALAKSLVGQISNRVIAVGYEAMDGSRLTDVATVICGSRRSCTNVMIRGIHKELYIYGYNSIIGSTIITESPFDDYSVLTITIVDTQDEWFDVYCNSTDRCKIKCESTNACSHMNLHCFGLCFVDCNNNSNETSEIPIKCPNMIIGDMLDYDTLSPTYSPTVAPTETPSISPTQSPTDDVIPHTIYMYYDDAIDDPLSLNIHQYAQDLANASVAAIEIVLNDTLLNTVCNITDPYGISCDLSNYNPWTELELDSDDDSRRRVMLNDEYSYKYKGNFDSEGWWQGRVENLQFCVVLDKLKWDPNKCSKYDETRFEEEEAFATKDAQYVAFGTFDIVADEQVDSFNYYFEKRLMQNSTLFRTILSNLVNKWFYRGIIATESASGGFYLVSFTIATEYDRYIHRRRDTFETAALDITFALYGFMGFCIIIAIVARMHAAYVGSDNVKLFRIVLFGIWTWDFVSDLIFSTRALEQGYYNQGLLGWIFVLIPWTLNIIIMVKSQKQWMQDNSIKYAVSYWLVSNSKMLVILTIICGSAFAAIDLCNSGAFGMDMFNMGLTERHVKKFHGNKIFSTVLFENLPQVTIQIWYFIQRSDTDIVVVLAFLSSVASIFIAFIDIYSSISLISAVKLAKNEGYFQIETYFFDIIGTAVAKYSDKFKLKPNAMRKILAEVLEIDIRCVECNSIMSVDDGIQFGFTVFVLNKSRRTTSVDLKYSSDRLNRLFRIYECAIINKENGQSMLLSSVIKLWKLETGINNNSNNNSLDLKIANILTFYDINDRKYSNFQKDYQTILESNFYKENSGKFIFEKIGMFETVCIDLLAQADFNPNESTQSINTSTKQRSNDEVGDEIKDDVKDATDEMSSNIGRKQTLTASRCFSKRESLRIFQHVHEQVIQEALAFSPPDLLSPSGLLSPTGVSINATDWFKGRVSSIREKSKRKSQRFFGSRVMDNTPNVTEPVTPIARLSTVCEDVDKDYQLDKDNGMNTDNQDKGLAMTDNIPMKIIQE